jgi:DNA-binding NarL/FixJ family response regulator
MEPSSSVDVVSDPIRVVLVGTERVTRAGLRVLLERQASLRVIGEIECTSDLEAVLSAEGPQVVVVDLDSPGGLDFIPEVRIGEMPSTRMIVLTSAPESSACASAIQRGVLGVVSKQQTPEVLIKAIERVHAGEAWLNRAAIAGLLGNLRASAPGEAPRQANSGGLLPRERQVVTLVGQGFRNNEIAATIFVSEATVRNCLATIFKKLHLTSRVQLMMYAVQEGFVNLSAPRSLAETPSRLKFRLARSTGRPARDGADVPSDGKH